MNTDTVSLLKEINSGCKMAIDSIDQIKEFTKGDELKRLIDEYRDEHVGLKERSAKMLESAEEECEKPNVMASAFSWFSTEMKMTMNNEDSQVAKIMMDGCNMGIQSIGEYVNKYATASKEAQDLARELIRSEEEFSKKMEKFL